VGVLVVRLPLRLPGLEGDRVNLAIGMFFLGLAIGLIFGMVIHWVFATWETASRELRERNPW
jgi:L-cystine uptake protein TcyP (sodium:dicarboxylate symporter family)